MKRFVSLFLACMVLFAVAMPASAADQQSTYVPFVDVKEGAYYYDAVRWAVKSGITAGTDKIHFSPNAICTRAQVATFVWRSFGSPNPKLTNSPFRDVKKSDYFYKAVLWCMENGITTGTSNGYFSPTEYCTRGQVAVFLFRSAVYLGNWTDKEIAENSPAHTNNSTVEGSIQLNGFSRDFSSIRGTIRIVVITTATAKLFAKYKICPKNK